MSKKPISEGQNMTDIKYNIKRAKDDNIVGNKIAEIRKERRLTQSDLVEALSGYGVSIHKTAAAKWEKGTTVPTAYQLIAISLALNAPDIIAEFTDIIPLPDLELNELGLKKLDEYRELLIASGKYKPVISEKAANIATVTIPTSYIKAAAGSGNFMDEENFEDKE